MRNISAVENPEKIRYRLPRGLVLRVIWDVIKNNSRDIFSDWHRAINHLADKIRVLGKSNIPRDGAFLITCNHYSRPGLGAWWGGLAITAAIAEQLESPEDQSIHWVMTSAWTYPRGDWRRWILTPVSRQLFCRLANMYHFIAMPPMPPDPSETVARTVAVLRTVKLARQLSTTGGVIGLAPEGQDHPGLLGEPPIGVGNFVAMLVQAGMGVLPVGVQHKNGYLYISFGPVYTISIPPDRRIRDAVVSDLVMSRIREQIQIILDL
jgi:hypothetical protein